MLGHTILEPAFACGWKLSPLTIQMIGCIWSLSNSNDSFREIPRGRYSYLNDADTDIIKIRLVEDPDFTWAKRQLGIGEKKALDGIVMIVLLHGFHGSAPLWGSAFVGARKSSCLLLTRLRIGLLWFYGMSPIGIDVYIIPEWWSVTPAFVWLSIKAS